MGRLLAVALLVALLAVPAASARTAKLTPAENRWAVPVVNLITSLSGHVGAIRSQVKDPAVLTKGSKARKKLTATLREIVVCGDKLKRDGPPPTARLKPFYTAVTSACGYYGEGSAQLIVGVARLSAALIRTSLTTFQRGSAVLAVAQTRLAALAA